LDTLIVQHLLSPCGPPPVVNSLTHNHCRRKDKFHSNNHAATTAVTAAAYPRHFPHGHHGDRSQSFNSDSTLACSYLSTLNNANPEPIRTACMPTLLDDGLSPHCVKQQFVARSKLPPRKPERCGSVVSVGSGVTA
jgi:hypothetical protein